MEMNDIQPFDIELFKKNAACLSGMKAGTLEMKGALRLQLEQFSKELMIGQPIRMKEELLPLIRKNQLMTPLGQIGPDKSGCDAEILKSATSALNIKFFNYSVLSYCQAFYKNILGQFFSQYKLADFFQRIFEVVNRIDETNGQRLSAANTCVNFPSENRIAEFLYLMKVCTTVKCNKPFYNSKQKLACCSI